MGVENVRRGLCMGIILIMNSLGQNGQRMVGEELGDAEIVALFIVQVRHMVAAVARRMSFFRICLRIIFRSLGEVFM